MTKQDVSKQYQRLVSFLEKTRSLLNKLDERSCNDDLCMDF